ncbi:hypothetical protein PCAR4_1210041 [Paraburkholderia caribensis]|nr:hypothetical protein PCAR4_1210041 [Paraburkholderia caribensis]
MHGLVNVVPAQLRDKLVIDRGFIGVGAGDIAMHRELRPFIWWMTERTARSALSACSNH